MARRSCTDALDLLHDHPALPVESHAAETDTPIPSVLTDFAKESMLRLKKSELTRLRMNLDLVLERCVDEHPRVGSICTGSGAGAFTWDEFGEQA